MKKPLIVTLSAFVASLSCMVLLSRAQDKPAPPLSVAQRIESLVKHPLVVETKDYKVVDKESYGHKLQAESTQHSKGLYRAKDIQFDVYKIDPLRVGFYSEPEFRLIRPDAKVLSSEECRKIGDGFLREAFSWFYGGELLPPVKTIGPSGAGIYTFEWQRYRITDELPDTDVSVSVRALDGKIVGFGASKFEGTWKHTVTPSQAKQKAIEYGVKTIGLKNVSVSQWRVDGGGGRRNYAIGLEAIDPKIGQVLATSVSVGAENGVVIGSMEGWRVVPDITKLAAKPPKDGQPVWTKQGLTFTSQRTLAGMPAWAPSQEQLFVRNAQGQISYVTSDLVGGKFSSASASTSGDWMVFKWHNWGYALDLKRGDYRVLANPDRQFITPAVRPDGTWAVAAGIAATGNAGMDLGSGFLRGGKLRGWFPYYAIIARVIN